MNDMARFRLKLERYLYAKGFTDALLRKVMLTQIGFSALALTFGIICLCFTRWFFFLFAGIGLVALNFWGLSLAVFKCFPAAYSRQFLFGHLCRFAGRMFFTGGVLLLCVWLGAPPAALGLGIASCLLVIALTALFGLSTAK